MKTKEELDAYLARIRRTIAESESLVGQAELRISETDRLLEKQGLTREDVRKMSFSAEQREAANRELARLGMEPLPEEEEPFPAAELQTPIPPPVAPPPSAGDDPELANRRMKFSMMMKPFHL